MTQVATRELNLNGQIFETTTDILSQCSPDYPTYVFRPHIIEKNCQLFKTYFPGQVAYAIKANDATDLLELLSSKGISCFDTASISEVKRIKQVAPMADILYMNPVKSPDSIRSAYRDYGVTAFSLDSVEELHKIIKATEKASNLHLFVRLSVSSESSVLDLNSKFGISESDGIHLLNECHKYAERVSICFHVGSQCISPRTFEKALHHVSRVVSKLSFPIYAVDIGGGFPAQYKDTMPNCLRDTLASIRSSLETVPFPPSTTFICEPGRALVAAAYSLMTMVIGKKSDNQLYLNDGVYGGLFELQNDLEFPVRVLKPLSSQKIFDTETKSFTLWGPSCDSYDKIAISYDLPKNIEPGDIIEFGQAGAYSRVFRSNFNGFYEYNQVICKDNEF